MKIFMNLNCDDKIFKLYLRQKLQAKNEVPYDDAILSLFVSYSIIEHNTSKPITPHRMLLLSSNEVQTFQPRYTDAEN